VIHRQLRVAIRDRRIASAPGGPFDLAKSAAHFDAHARINCFRASPQILKEIADAEAGACLLGVLNGARRRKEWRVSVRRARFQVSQVCRRVERDYESNQTSQVCPIGPVCSFRHVRKAPPARSKRALN
jgi:hypothetical protein